jgi:hypothetical protein
VSQARLAGQISALMPGWQIVGSERISNGFYKSEAMEIRR